MSRSGCKESKVATGAFAAPTQQHQHTPSEHAVQPPPRAEEMENGVEEGATLSPDRRDITAASGGRMVVPLFITPTKAQQSLLLTHRFFS